MGTKKWMQYVLWIAGVYNILWGTVVILFPNLFFDLVGMERPLYPMIWQCVGMVIGVYGVGYFIAGYQPLRHWPIVLVGFLGKIFGPIGFVYYLATGAFPLYFGLTIIFNDLIWWIPFGLILLAARRSEQLRPELTTT
jgi:small multidrug resistance pump